MNAFFLGRTKWKKGWTARGARQKGRRRWRSAATDLQSRLFSSVGLESSRRQVHRERQGAKRHEAPLLSPFSPPDLSCRVLCYRSASGGILKAAERRARSGVCRDTCSRADRVCRICRTVVPAIALNLTPEIRLVSGQALVSAERFL